MESHEFPVEKVKSRKARICPECGTDICVGETYTVVAGVHEGSFFKGIMCLPCNDLRERYLASMLANNADPVEYHFGEIINEALDYIDLRIQLPSGLTHAQRRGVLLSVFEFHDLACKHLREEKHAYYRKQKVQFRATRQSISMIDGMSGHGSDNDILWRTQMRVLRLETIDYQELAQQSSARMINGMSRYGGIPIEDTDRI